MNYKLIIIGLIFLFNPEINIIDPLPDFIGILFILKGITSVALLSPTLADAASAFKKYFWISFIQFAAIIPLISVAASDPAFYLVFTFAFAVLSILYIIPAFTKLFSGIEYLAEKNALRLYGIHILTVIFTFFFIIKKILSLIPELIYLYIDDRNVYDTALYPLAPYKTGIISITVTVSLIIGILWLVIAAKYFSKLKKNAEYNKAISQNISEINHTVSQIAMRTVSAVSTLLTVSAFSMISFYIDGIQIIPQFISAVCIYQTVRTSGRLLLFTNKSKKKIPIFSLLVGIVSYIISLIFNIRYHETAILNFSRVSEKFAFPALINLISCVLYILSLYSIYSIVKRIIDEHTGTYWENSYISHNSASAKEKENLQFKLKIGVIIGACLSISNTVAYDLLYIIPLYQIINSAAVLIWAVYMSSVYSSIKNAVQEKYADESMRNPAKN